MAELPKEVLFDVRMVERHIRQGLISRQDYERHLAQVADSAPEADVVDLDELAETRPRAVSQRTPS